MVDPFSVGAALLSLPTSLASLLEIYEWLRSEDSNGPISYDPACVAQDTKRQCVEGQEKAKSIPSERKKQEILKLLDQMESIALDISSDTPQPILRMVFELNGMLMDALDQALNLPGTSSDEGANIKEKMRSNRPVPKSMLLNIYCSTLPSHFKDGAKFCNFNDDNCLVEYSRPCSTEDTNEFKMRLCWMSLLVKSITCRHLVKPVQVFQSQDSGFYTLNRVGDYVGSLCTLDSKIMIIKKKKKVLLALCIAVEEIHKETIVHKNICPQNIIVDEDDNAWLAGLSGSRLFFENSFTNDPRAEERRFKMIYYVSEDSFKYPRTFNCDIYAMGVTMLEIASRKCFVDSDSDIKSRKDIHDLLEKKNGALEILISHCLSEEARRRPKAHDIRKRIEDMDDTVIDQSFQS